MEQLANLKPKSDSDVSPQSQPAAATLSPQKRKVHNTRSLARAEEDATPPKKKKKSGPSGLPYRCAKEGCGVPFGTAEITFCRVPPYPLDLPDGASMAVRLAHRGKIELRREANDRIGRARGDTTKDLRVCSQHRFETINRRLYIKHNQTKVSQKFELTVMSGAGVDSSLVPSKTTKGIGNDRRAQNQLNFLHKEMEKASSPQTVPLTTSCQETDLERAERLRIEAECRAAAAILMALQVVECHSSDALHSSEMICPSVSKSPDFVLSTKSSALLPIQKKNSK